MTTPAKELKNCSFESQMGLVGSGVVRFRKDEMQ